MRFLPLMLIFLAACESLPTSLFDTGLYQEDHKTLAEGVMEYTPRVSFWSDGATKTRYVFIPEGKKVDISDLVNWAFPDGTKLWKEFKRDGTLVETRLIERKDGAWLGRAYVWNAEGTQADSAGQDGEKDVNGTAHDVPEEFSCKACHEHTGEWPLSFSALQLDHDESGLTLKDLDEKGLLSQSPPENQLAFPGTEPEQAALAYLHVNCGNCHHEKLEPPPPDGFGPPEDLQLKVLVSELGGLVADTELHRSTVGVKAESDNDVAGLENRIVAGDADQSVLFKRMATRDGDQDPSIQMPPAFGGSEIDDDGLAIVRAFIEGL
jgi:cytochrome c553